ncbi:hypothetical protein BJ165DRAFT_1485608 [Panaeolus papilionaceus]|nr:hypothetical protein BJ165DRAFT_1485608 [Panaeolus papilionaceus]
MNHAGHAYPNNINDDDQIPSDIVNHNGHNQTNDSPATPVSNVAAPDVKIDMDYQEQESDARHEPFPIKLIDDQLDKGHVVTEITSNDQGNIIIKRLHNSFAFFFFTSLKIFTLSFLFQELLPSILRQLQQRRPTTTSII